MFAYCNNNPCNNLDPSGNSYMNIADAGSDIRSKEAMPLDSTTLLSAIALLYATNIVCKAVAMAGSDVRTVIKKNELQDTYTVYFLSAADDISNKITYVGRVKTKNLDKRMSYHASKNRMLVGCISGLDYKTCRAIEQAGMIYHHTINIFDPIYNQIRGISPQNKNLYNYMAAIADLVFTDQYPDNSLLPVSYFYNWTEETFLALSDY